MPIVELEPSLSYYLINHDENGKEFPDRNADGGLLSDLVKKRLCDRQNSVSDIFVVSHGWKSDQQGAQRQYTDWFKTMTLCVDDIAAMAQIRSGGFHPVVIGMHWPSILKGDEELHKQFANRREEKLTPPTPEQIEEQKELLSNDVGIQEAYKEVIYAILSLEENLLEDDESKGFRSTTFSWGTLEKTVPNALARLEEGLSLPRNTFINFIKRLREIPKDQRTPPSKASFEAMSFWQMRDRAKQFGYAAVNVFLDELRRLPIDGWKPRLHLVGHSFGCMVISAAINGPAANGRDAVEVDSVILLQGALSAYSFCKNHPAQPGHQGEFNLISSKVKGALVSTQSRFDTAVGHWYPIAARFYDQTEYEINEKVTADVYGALGTFGAQGEGIKVAKMAMKSIDENYDFVPGAFHNVDSSKYICESLSVMSGAHCDLTHAEVAHLVWQAAMSAP